MGSGKWLRALICLKPVKGDRSKRAKLLKQVHSSTRRSSVTNPTLADKEVAALKIQNAFRVYMARKMLNRLRGAGRFNILIQSHSAKKQSYGALGTIHSWCNIQSQINARRLCMVTQGRIKQKRLENQLKLEAKLRDIEEEWCGGSETMEEVLAKIQQREEAAVKRERAMAYAFSHQWKPASQYLGQAYFSLGQENWGWSWMERWVAARPWEVRVQSQNHHKPKKGHTSGSEKMSKVTEIKAINGKEIGKCKRVCFV